MPPPKTFREVPGHPGRFEPHNPGLPLWRIIVCKAVTFLYDIMCREQKSTE
jgi:hypothetical protein